MMVFNRSKGFFSSLRKKQQEENVGVFKSTGKVVLKEQKAEIKSATQHKKPPPKPYNSELVGVLKSEHVDLLRLYKQLMASADERDFDAIPFHLIKFNQTLTEHLKHEDSDLYIYMDFYHERGNFFNEQAMLKDFRSEMKEITIELSSLINQSPNIPVTDRTIDGFLFDFNLIGEILQDRIHREETVLYPLYNDLNPNNISL